VVLGAAVSLAACGGSENKSASFNMTIGHLAPVTGYLSDFAPPAGKAADLAAAQINQAIDEVGADQTVTLKQKDDHTDTRAGVRAARELVDADNATCLVGSWSAAVSQRVAKEVAIPDKVLQISPAVTDEVLSDLADNGLVNRTATPDSLQGSALADVIEDNLGGAQGKRVSIGASNDAYGKSIARSFGVAWQRKGGRVGSRVSYGPEQRSYGSEAKKIVSGGPAAFVIAGSVTSYQKLGPALVRTGRWDPAKTFVTDGLASNNLPKLAGSDATEGMRGTVPGSPDTGEAAESFDQLYTKDAGSSRGLFDAQTFDAVILCYLAAVAAGRPDGADLAQELRAVSGPGGKKYTWEQLPDAIKALQGGDDIDYEGASGPIDLDDKGDPTAGVYDLFRFKDGKADVFGEVPVAPDANRDG
jgi:ABC-type branched-subunit amino acid transport system substrate-binding protein